jgi:ATP-dependent DNA helicase 2 subunit 1
MGIAWLIPRRNQAPMFVAILPQEEELDEKGNQITPPGMHCVQFPTLDDTRLSPVDSTVAGRLPH